MSPSGVGKYALCTKRLVAEADHPEWDEPSGPAACFGTVCHYGTQLSLGLAPPKPPSEYDFRTAKLVKHLNAPPITSRSALSKKSKEVFDFITAVCGNQPEPTKEKPLDPAAFYDRVVEASCKAAVAALPELPEGVRWVAEHHVNLPTLLPERIGKTGNRGFSGSIDLMRSDRSELWDLKFPGEAVNKVEFLYVAQLASYHIITGIPRTGLFFIPVGGLNPSRFLIDWRIPAMKDLCDSLRGFISWTDDAAFRRHAWYAPGENCKYCYLNPKKWPRPQTAEICPIFALPDIIDLAPASSTPKSAMPDLAPAANDDFLRELRQNADDANGTSALGQPVARKPVAAKPNDLF